MSLIECKGCQELISKKSESCPKCGEPNKKKTGPVAMGCLVFMVLFGFLCVGGAVSEGMDKAIAIANNQKGPDRSNAYISSRANSWEARSITTHYAKNEVSADQDFKDRVVTVTGQVDSIKKGILGKMYVTLSGHDFLHGVQCFFEDDKASQLANLSKGQQVSITGVCDGLMMNVLFSNCVIN